MDKLEQIVRGNPTIPRLVVRHHRAPDGGDGFEWGIVGGMPVVSASCAAERAVVIGCSWS